MAPAAAPSASARPSISRTRRAATAVRVRPRWAWSVRRCTRCPRTASGVARGLSMLQHPLSITCASSAAIEPVQHVLVRRPRQRQVALSIVQTTPSGDTHSPYASASSEGATESRAGPHPAGWPGEDGPNLVFQASTDRRPREPLQVARVAHRQLCQGPPLVPPEREDRAPWRRSGRRDARGHGSSGGGRGGHGLPGPRGGRIV